MTLCGLLLGTEPSELVQKMKDRAVTAVDIVVGFSFYEFDSPRYNVRVGEIMRVNGKPAFFSDRIQYRDWAYDGERFVSVYRKTFHYPVAGKVAFETAELLHKNGIAITVGGKLIDIAEKECKEYIGRAVRCCLSSL
ncbi:MAG TPA: hypothetical protein VJI32_03735 [Candidatus Nanoarchaeia archaeon]|nr:hypothetical protein [Candidatus Nanoarchaeia archaeon]